MCPSNIYIQSDGDCKTTFFKTTFGWVRMYKYTESADAVKTHAMEHMMQREKTVSPSLRHVRIKMTGWMTASHTYPTFLRQHTQHAEPPELTHVTATFGEPHRQRTSREEKHPFVYWRSESAQGRRPTLTTLSLRFPESIAALTIFDSNPCGVNKRP